MANNNIPIEILERARPDSLGARTRRYGSPNVIEFPHIRRLVISGNVTTIVIGIATLIACAIISANRTSKQRIRDDLITAGGEVAGLLYTDDADKSITKIDAAMTQFEMACNNAIKELGDAAPDCKTTIEKDREYVRRAFGAFCARKQIEERVSAVCEDTSIAWLHDTDSDNPEN